MDEVAPPLIRGLEFEPRYKKILDRECFPRTGPTQHKSGIIELQCGHQIPNERQKKSNFVHKKFGLMRINPLVFFAQISL